VFIVCMCNINKGGCESPRGALNCVKLELSCTTKNTYGDVVVLQRLHLFA
jgi:hypothetical protein